MLQFLAESFLIWRMDKDDRVNQMTSESDDQEDGEEEEQEETEQESLEPVDRDESPNLENNMEPDQTKVPKEPEFTSEEVREPRSFQPPTSGVYSKNRGSGKGVIVALALVVLLIIGGAAYFLRGQLSGSKPSPSPSSESEIESPLFEPSSSPESSIDRSDYKIRVLNGTKTAGLAASVSAKLKELGYEIEKTGNATNSAFTKTIIRVKKDIDDLLQQLIKDISADFKAEKGIDLKESDAADAEIILGAD